jgi:hypothetical protein
MLFASAIGVPAIADAGNLNRILVFGFEEEAVIAAAEPELGAWRLEFFHVTATG